MECFGSYMNIAILFLTVALLGNFETVNYTGREEEESSGNVEAESESVNQKMVAPEHPALARQLLLEGRIGRNNKKVWKGSPLVVSLCPTGGSSKDFSLRGW